MYDLKTKAWIVHWCFMSNSITQHTNLYTMSSNNDTFILFTHQWLRTLHLCKAEGFLANWKLTLSLLFLVWLTRDVSFSRKRKKKSPFDVFESSISCSHLFLDGQFLTRCKFLTPQLCLLWVNLQDGLFENDSVKLSPLTCDFYPEKKNISNHLYSILSFFI